MGMRGWRVAAEAALYGPDGFYVRDDGGPATHFRTSAHGSPAFVDALIRLITRVDRELGRPPVFDLVDVGAGRGELLTAVGARLPTDLADRARLTAVERAPRPAGLSPEIAWTRAVPGEVVGLLVATEWLDNVPVDIAETDERGHLRQVLVDPATGTESLGAAVTAADRLWIARWWPPGAGTRIEIGWPRDTAWADAVAAVRRGCALTVDYGHVRDARPAYGTLAGFRHGRQVEPVPDGTTDITTHVAMDSAAMAAGTPYRLIRQRAALTALGVRGDRPSLELAGTDPRAYLRALAQAGEAASLTDPAGLGGHWWLLHTIGIDPRASMVG
ncbi:SAM-dependent methyltransferase [Mangrovihabitans endophyticus]|uniref:SAM-dependent methyltransferase, MidA family n=1 Tax=Mangrovihabitans endophyticus TaxID=1751298 RepID=A0A8J3FPZ3_9ACTN|nr:SAM-dependent methyltransferase [Mangrovihabitans endophyticus]GGL03155.1 hypothetical protein GCM10012284_42240 [Mangrovihabitans endophyticus]